MVSDLSPSGTLGRNEALSSGVSWGAVIGGAFAAASVYLILLALGAGMGLSAVSPWNSGGTPLTALTIIWLILIEIVASALGGYLTGRLRTKWVSIHSDEVYFRDTANGFLSWSVALVLTVTFLVSAAATMVGASRPARTQEEASGDAIVPHAYFVDRLFRSDKAGAANAVGSAGSIEAEASRIVGNALVHDRLTPEDQSYLARLVAARTDMSTVEAEKRVTDTIAAARQAADEMRKETARLLLWLFLSLLMGAFSASYAAITGGRNRDHVVAV
jgi:hypothetical protein